MGLCNPATGFRLPAHLPRFALYVFAQLPTEQSPEDLYAPFNCHDLFISFISLAFRVQLPTEQSPEDLYAALNIIKDPSMIRVESDEVR